MSDEAVPESECEVELETAVVEPEAEAEPEPEPETEIEIEAEAGSEEALKQQSSTNTLTLDRLRTSTTPASSSISAKLMSANQSIPVCAFFVGVLLIVVVIVEVIDLPVYNEYNEYASAVKLVTPVEYQMRHQSSNNNNSTNNNNSLLSELSILEWQFSQKYVPPNERTLSPVLLWFLTVIVVWVVYCVVWLGMNCKHENKTTRTSGPTTTSDDNGGRVSVSVSVSVNVSDWLFDDLLSFAKGYMLCLFVCRTLFVIVSARISLPIPSFYDLCQFDVHTGKCNKSDAHTIQEAYSATPNADIGWLCSSLVFLSFYLCGKLSQCVLYPCLSSYLNRHKNSNQMTKNQNEQNSANTNTNTNTNTNANANEYMNDLHLVSLFGVSSMVLPFIPFFVAVVLSVSVIHDNCAMDWDFNLSMISSVLITYYAYTSYYENPFECMDIETTMSYAGIPKQSIAYQKMKKRCVLRQQQVLLLHRSSNDAPANSPGSIAGDRKMKINKFVSTKSRSGAPANHDNENEEAQPEIQFLSDISFVL